MCKMIVRLPVRSKFKEKSTKQLVTGPCLFFSKLIQIFEGRIPSRRLLHQPLYNHASSCTTVFWHQMRLAETVPKTCEVFKCLTLKFAKELIWRDTQAVLAQVDFTNKPLARKESRGKHIQSIIAQVKFFKTTEITKKTFWKCSQFVALQIKFVQTAEILKKTFWKSSQFVALQGKPPQTVRF